MEEDEQLYAMRKAAQNVVEAAQKTLGELNGAIAQLRGLTSGLQSVSVATLHQVEQGAQKGVQEALQQAASLDLAPQIEAAVKPTLNSVRRAVGNLSSATTEAGAAVRAIAKHKLGWYQRGSYFGLGAIIGIVIAWIFCLQPLREIQQTLSSISVAQCVPVPNQATALPPKPQTKAKQHQKQAGPEPTNAEPVTPALQ